MRLALTIAALLAASHAHAGEVRCWRFADELRCDDGSRIHSFAGTTTIKRPGKRDVRCWRAAGELRCGR